MKIKLSAILFLALIVGPLCFADYQEQAAQVSKVTGVATNNVAKMAEAMDKWRTAMKLAQAKQYDEAFTLLDEITVKNGFDYENERQAKITKIETMILAGDFAEAYRTALELNEERALLEEYLGFIKAMADFSANKDSKNLLNYIELFNSKNKNIIPPKVYNSNYLSRMVRLYEMAGEIDKALRLVRDFQSYYFSKKMLSHQNAIINRKREGLELLEEALLRDKQENKNIYAQEFINTTDYFGFV
jgi:hypothetical protein